jgi:hypothetical protein
MEVTLSTIVITYRIVNAVKKYKPDIDLSGFCIVEDGTLPLNRMENMMSLDFESLIDKEPVQLRETFDGYRILNGRHRIARAIIEGRISIKAKTS